MIFKLFNFVVKPSDLLGLNGFFGKEVTEAALDILDSKRIKLYTTARKSRNFIEVEPSYRTGTTFKIFPNINYCPCKSFRTEVLAKDIQYTCKHVLASKLAIISGKFTTEIVSDDLFIFLIQQISEQYLH